MTDALTSLAAPGYVFTRKWFKNNAEVWAQVFQQHRPERVLEIGSFEGFSACWSILQAQRLGLQRFELHCVDTWEGGIEHQSGTYAEPMGQIESHFQANIARARQDAQPLDLQVHIHRSLSYLALADLIAARRLGHFDFIYVDGSHQAPDVLTDAVLAFPLLRVGGIMVFDDYLWTLDPQGEQNPLTMPKPAVDAFANLFMRKVSVVKGGPRDQLFLRKHSD
jgi:predicted O-methyltransferase YrrM